MRVIVVDDDESMLLILKKMLSKIPEVEICGSFQSTGEAYVYIKENKVDMAFVDISMPEESGLEFVRRFSSDAEDIAVCFLTAHKEYALEAFDVHAFDYIVKPVSQFKLENSIQRAKRRFFLGAKEEALSTRLSAYCLGGMEVRYPGNGTVQFSSSKSSELLAYLLFKKGRFVSKWCVMEDVFRGMPPQNAETYLNTTIYKLRKVFEAHGMKSAIISANESYKIDMRNIYVDFIDFENRITSLFDFGSSNLEAALETEKLYTGELFGEKDYPWSLPEKERLSEVYWSFAIKLSGYLLENGHLTSALHILKKLVQMNALDDEANFLLMRVYAAKKDKLSVERQYERYSRVLHRELGVNPGEMASRLYAELVKSFW